jgi:hypothetical protein
LVGKAKRCIIATMANSKDKRRRDIPIFMSAALRFDVGITLSRIFEGRKEEMHPVLV